MKENRKQQKYLREVLRIGKGEVRPTYDMCIILNELRSMNILMVRHPVAALDIYRVMVTVLKECDLHSISVNDTSFIPYPSPILGYSPTISLLLNDIPELALTLVKPNSDHTKTTINATYTQESAIAKIEEILKENTATRISDNIVFKSVLLILKDGIVTLLRDVVNNDKLTKENNSLMTQIYSLGATRVCDISDRKLTPLEKLETYDNTLCNAIVNVVKSFKGKQ